jgi:hypothetical protein
MRGQLHHAARKEKNPPGEKRAIFSHFLQQNSDTTKFLLRPSTPLTEKDSKNRARGTMRGTICENDSICRGRARMCNYYRLIGRIDVNVMDTPSPHQVSVNVDPAFWDMFIASLVLIRHQGAMIIVHAIFPLAGLALLLLSYMKGFPQGITPVIGLSALAIFFTPLITAVGAFSARRNKLMQGPFTYFFDSEGVRTKGVTFDQTINWTAIAKVRQSKSFLFIFISPTKALYIPMKALREQGVIDKVCEIARQHSDLK